MAYQGSKVTIALGQYGLLTDLPPSDIPGGALILANNVSYETGAVTKAPGSRKYNSSALPAGVVALHDWWPDIYTQRLIALCSDGSIYRDIGDRGFSSNTAITSGLLNVTTNAVFVEGGNETAARNKKLFLFTGTNQLKVLSGDGTSFSSVTSPATDWTTPNFPSFGFIHRNRLWAFMGNRYYASPTGDHEDFTSGTVLTGSVFPGEGGNIVGGWVFKGRPFVFKEGGFVYYLEDSDTSSSNWFWRKLSSNFGLASPHAVFEITNDMIAFNESGAPISYSAVNTYGGIDAADVYKNLNIAQFIRSKTSVSGLSKTHTLYYPDKKQVFITSRTGYRTNNDLMIMMDFNTQRPRVSLWDKDRADCLALRKDINKIQRPMYGASDGFVYLMDQEDRLVGAAAYTGEFKIAHTDFRQADPLLASKNKLFDHLAVEFVSQGEWNVEIDVYIDGKYIETINFLQSVKDDGLAADSSDSTSFLLDTTRLGTEESQTIEKPLHGSGRRISFHIKQSGSNQNFSIASLTVGFRVSGEQATNLG